MIACLLILRPFNVNCEEKIRKIECSHLKKENNTNNIMHTMLDCTKNVNSVQIVEVLRFYIYMVFTLPGSSETVSYLYTPGGVCGRMKLFSRSRSTSFSIRTWEGSRSLGSFAGRMVSDWKKAAWSLREEAVDSMD